jgi:hypothetical protein
VPEAFPLRNFILKSLRSAKHSPSKKAPPVLVTRRSAIVGSSSGDSHNLFKRHDTP